MKENRNQSLLSTIKTKYVSEITVFLALIIIWVALSVASPFFFQFKNVMNIGLYSSFLGVSASAMTMCVIASGIDLSVGSIMALSGVIVASVAANTDSFLLSMAAGLSVGVACGMFNGLIVTKGKISSFITTLSTMLIYRGFAYIYTEGGSIICDNEAIKKFGRGYILSIPIPVVVMVVCFVLVWLILSKTEFGRNIYAVGGNVTASYLAGININRTQFGVFIISGFMAGLAGFLITAQSGAGLPQAADGYQMDIIAAVILGGASLNGGKGNVIGTVLGIIMLSTLSNGMTLLNIPSFWQLVAKGTVLILAVLLDVARNGGYSKKQY